MIETKMITQAGIRAERLDMLNKALHVVLAEQIKHMGVGDGSAFASLQTVFDKIFELKNQA